MRCRISTTTVSAGLQRICHLWQPPRTKVGQDVGEEEPLVAKLPLPRTHFVASEQEVALVQGLRMQGAMMPSQQFLGAAGGPRREAVQVVSMQNVEQVRAATKHVCTR